MTRSIARVAPWAVQAQRELRASGEHSRRRVPEARDQLTAQELQIAQLAAQGLSNREIGEQLFLSHRTISTHFYRVFPKLGMTSRAELGTVLAPVAVETERQPFTDVRQEGEDLSHPTYASLAAGA